MTKRNHQRRGQALLLVTFALIAMCGMLGLAVDLGWGYFVKKSAQASADAGALAAAYHALDQVERVGPLPNKWGASGSCPYTGPAAPITTGCKYAQQPGFGGAVSMISGLASAPPTVLNVTAEYWVTVRAVQTIPQLFSAVLGNPTGVSSARATAAVIPVVINGSLITLNRAGDPNPTDVSMSGSGRLTLPGGLYAAASDNNSNHGIQVHGAAINGPIFEISPATNPGAGGTNTFQAQPDGAQFQDPMTYIVQPPLTASALNTYAVVGGSLSNIIKQVNSSNQIIGQLSGGGADVTLPPGNYFPASLVPCGPSCTPTVVMPLTSNSIDTAGGTVTFSNGGSFGSYFFWGGLHVGGTLNMGPGQYVVVGRGLDNQGVMQDPNAASDGGQMIVLTGTSTSTLTGSYPNITNNANSDLYLGLKTQANSNASLAQLLSSDAGLFGQTTFNKSADGTGDPTGVNTASGAPSDPSPSGWDLSRYNGVVLWQDQANSTVLYNAEGGTINTSTSCGGGGTINSPCRTPANGYTVNPNINFYAKGDAGLRGIFYQPRGAGFTSIGNGGGEITGRLQIITGYFASSNGGGLNLQDPPVPLVRRRVVLVE